MEPRRFVVLDRDGTINEERDYLSDPCQVALIPGVGQGLRQLRDMGLGLIVVTNQSGIGRGMFDEHRLGQIHQRLTELLDAQSVQLDGIYYCPHTPDDGCDCRKPRPGLLHRAAADLGLDPSGCFVIGDSPCDIELGQNVGATTFLVRTGYGRQVAADATVQPDYTVDNLGAAVPIIRRLVTG